MSTQGPMEPVDSKEQAKVTHDERLSSAEEATAQDHDLGLLQAIRLYPKGIFWSVAMSTALVMEGYDTKLISTLYAQPAFKRTYGVLQPGGDYQIPAAWQAGLSNGSTTGGIIGLVIAGSVGERFGFRKTVMYGMAAMMPLIFVQFFAPNLAVLQVSQILLGVPLGVFQTIPMVYALEISPTCLRAHLTTYVNLCWIFGQILASGVLRGTLDMQSNLAFRIPFAVQWLWPLILIPAIYFAPESPWWLVRKGRFDDTKKVVQRLTSPRNTSFDIDKNISLMIVTTEREREVKAATTYAACFTGTDLRRTVIVVGCYCIQVLSGNPLRAYATYFFQQAGLPTSQAFNMTIVSYVLGMVGVFIAWALLPVVGRRTLYLYGLLSMVGLFMAIGGFGLPLAKGPNESYSWAVGGLLLASSLINNITVNPVAYALVSEIPSSLLRSKSVVVARATYLALTIVAQVITPYQLNSSAWGWGARAGFFWAGSAFIALAFTYLYIPEPKDRTTAELDILFENKVSARHFSKKVVSLTDAANTKQQDV